MITNKGLSNEEAKSRLSKLGFELISEYTGCKKNVTVICHCGNSFSVRYWHLIDGHTKSCGCLRKEMTTGKNSKQWTGYETLSGSFWCLIESSARIRGLDFKITKEYVHDLFIKQQEKCALSGSSISLDKPRTASLDRINSKLGYIKDNVQWVHKDINKMKMDMRDEKFIEWCKRVAKNYENN